MATRIKETPVLYGKAAMKFLREINVNAKRDHRAEFARMQAACKRFKWTTVPQSLPLKRIRRVSRGIIVCHRV
jgi:hypothetical protein